MYVIKFLPCLSVQQPEDPAPIAFPQDLFNQNLGHYVAGNDGTWMETFGNILNKAITSSWKDDLDFLSDEHMAFNLTSHFHLTVSRGDNKGHRLVAPSGYAIKKKIHLEDTESK